MAIDKTRAAGWGIARARWEGEPRCSYSDLTDFLGISKQAIAKRAAKDGWQKRSNMAAIVDKAHVAADRETASETAHQTKDVSLVDGQPAIFQRATTGPTTPEMLAQAFEDVAVNARAQILTRHRNEWPAVRSQLYKAIRAQDIDGARLAKIAAESLKLVQDGERKAWGIDAGGDDKSVRIVIERTEGVRVVR